MIGSRAITLAPMHARFAVGYACTSTWAIVLLFSSAFGAPSDTYAALMSMLPGLVACISSIVFFKAFPSISGRTAFVIVASMLMAVGTLLYTHPSCADIAALRLGGLVLSGFFAIIVIMSWFDAFANLPPRSIIVTAGCALSIAAVACWAILSCSAAIASIASSLLPVISMALLPKSIDERDGCAKHDAGSHTVREVIGAAIPARTLLGLTVTFFIVRSIATLAPESARFTAAIAPSSLLIPLAITALFIGSAMLVKKRIDPSIFYKILLSCFAGCVFLLASSAGITAALVFYANLTAEVMTWTVLALWAKNTPVRPHLVFAIGWVAECAGNTFGQAATPLFAAQGHLFFAVCIVAILLAVSFAFSEGHLVLEVGFEDEDESDDEIGERPEKESGAEKPRENAGDFECDEREQEAERARQDAQARMDAFVAAHDISPRERDVLELWITGRGMKYIENVLFISESTVKSHLRSIYRKCDTHNRDETISLYEKETSDNHRP